MTSKTGLLHDGNDADEGTTVRMHDVVHRFAAYVGWRDHHIFYLSEGDRLEEWPDEDKLKHFKAIFFDYCSLPPDELPASFDTPELESFVMLRYESQPPVKIPDKFFEGMKRLKLMDLTCMSLLPALPTSLEVLVNLKTLCLDFCKLDDITIIGELPRLHVLSLIGSTIIHLPKELGKLVRLKLLDLDMCSSLKMIAPDVLLKLTSLEKLSMENSFKYWEKEGCCSSNSSIETIHKNASLKELKNMRNLVYLSIHIPHAEMLPKELLYFQLEIFKILVGEAWDWNNDYGTSKTLKLKLVECSQLECSGIKALIGRAEDVYLQQLDGFVSLSKLDSQGFPLMKHLSVQNGVQIRYMISISSCVVLPKLETLVLQDLEKLEMIIYHGGDSQIPKSGSFENLRKIKVERCNGLKDLFSQSLAKGLPCLKEIEVIDCRNMETIVSTDGEIIGELLFPHLSFIKLKSLPKMKTFCTANYIECPSLQQLFIEDSTNYASADATLFDGKVAFPNLDELNIVEMDGLKMIWQNELHPSSFSKLKTLKIEKATSLLTIFPPTMVRRASNLQNLTISNCESVREVFDVQMLIDESDIHGQVPPTQLRSLDISELPKLKHVWNRDPHGLLSYQNLCSVNARLCPSLKSLFPVSVALTLQQLEKLTIEDCEEMEEIVSMKEGYQEQSCAPRFLFPKVTYLKLWNLQSLKRFYPGSYSSDWPMLSKLSVFDSDKFDIFGSKLETIRDGACREEPCDNRVHRQPFLSFTKAIPNLEELSLRSQDLDVIYGQDLFTANKLRVLELLCFHDSSQVFPVSFLQNFPNLKTLVVRCPHSKQLLPYELVADETNAKTLARFSHLKLDALYKMTHLLNANSQLHGALRHLGSLEVWRCADLISLALSSALFENLTHLDVWQCNGLITLFTSSTAKSLVQLKRVCIRECNSLVQIVANGEDEAQIEDIVYEKLETVDLESLTSLYSFCSATSNFKFPSLIKVYMTECPNMEFFSQGILNTPKLTEVFVKKRGVRGYRGRWMDDLNSTVRRLYKEMNSS